MQAGSSKILTPIEFNTSTSSIEFEIAEGNAIFQDGKPGSMIEFGSEVVPPEQILSDSVRFDLINSSEFEAGRCAYENRQESFEFFRKDDGSLSSILGDKVVCRATAHI